MKILMVNKFFYIKGGSETYYFSLKKLLEKKGHTVIDFSMKDEKNFVSEYSNYFVENVNYNEGNILQKVRAGLKIVYSIEAKKRFEKLVWDTRPDLVHLHIFQHQLSPSILDILKKYRIPTVYTAHDLKMLCLNYKMLQHGKLCEQCRDGRYYRCAVNRCVKNSFFKSCINTVEGYVHHWHKSYDVIDEIITPSAFFKKKFEEFGIPEIKVTHISNFLDMENLTINRSEESEAYYLYFGRLSEEKGILTLLKAFCMLNVRLDIVGTGPLQKNVTEYIRKKGLEKIHFLGFKSGQELKDIVGNAKAVILPSEWYENSPYSIIEALQAGRPVIGADIGGIPELIDGNGFLFRSGDAKDLALQINRMESLSDDEYEGMKRASYRLFLRNHTADGHYQKLKQIYDRALAKKMRAAI